MLPVLRLGVATKEKNPTRTTETPLNEIRYLVEIKCELSTGAYSVCILAVGSDTARFLDLRRRVIPHVSLLN